MPKLYGMILEAQLEEAKNKLTHRQEEVERFRDEVEKYKKRLDNKDAGERGTGTSSLWFSWGR
jgi:hypothetical protein